MTGPYVRPRLLSLCSGYGGLDLAVEAATGAQTVAFAEFEAPAASIFERHWPGVPNLHDIWQIDWTDLGPIDIFTAGYPCQPFSHAGKRQGEHDDRHLWPAIREGIRAVRPGLVVLENVAGHLSLGFDAVLGDLAEARYCVRWTCLRAADVGAPHGRKRLFIVATDADHAADDGERSRTQSRCGGEGAATDTEGIGRSSRGSESDGGRAATGREGATSDSPDIGHERAGGAWGRGAGSADSRQLASHPDAEGSQGPQSAGRRDMPAGGGGPAPAHADSDGLARFAGPQARRVEVQPDERDHAHGCGDAVQWGAYGPAVTRWEAVIGRPAPAPTGARGRLAAPFVEWMMGLPAGWVTDTPGLSRTQQLKALGNGVVPQQAYAGVTTLLGSRKVAA